MHRSITTRVAAIGAALLAALAAVLGLSASPASATTGNPIKTAVGTDGVPISRSFLAYDDIDDNPAGPWKHGGRCIWNVPLQYGGHSGDTITATILWYDPTEGTKSVNLTVTDGDTQCSNPIGFSAADSSVHFIQHDTWFSGGCDTVYILEGAGSQGSACG